MNLVFQKGVCDFNVHVHLSLSIYLLSLLNGIVSKLLIVLKVHLPKFIFQTICIVSFNLEILEVQYKSSKVI
jgi:hypothetical protein